MPVAEALPYFARGFKNKAAIKYLLDLEERGVDAALAMNPYLSSAEIEILLFRATSITKTLLASRVDLTQAQSLEVVRSQDPLVITALLTSQGISRPKLSEEVIKELLGPGWISVSYASSILELMEEGSIYKGELLKLGTSTTNSVSLRQARRKNILKLQRTLKEGYFREYADLVAPNQINRIKRYKDGHTVDPLTARLPALLLEGDMGLEISSATTCEAVMKLAGNVGDEFFSLLFGLLPDWGLTLGELVSTALSLTSHPA